jgi:ribosome-binding factor A
VLNSPREQQIASRGAQRADQIRDTLASPLQRLFVGVVLSIARVTLSPDGKRATVWIRAFPAEAGRECLKVARRNKRQIQHELDLVITRRISPRISIELDESAERADAISSLLL